MTLGWPWSPSTGCLALRCAGREPVEPDPVDTGVGSRSMARDIEYVAAALAVLYLLLAIRQWRSCWFAAFISSCLFVLVFFRARLYMESLLNAFYAAMAIYGYWCWRATKTGEQGTRVHRWPLRSHALGLLGVLVLAAVNSWFLRRYTP